MRQEDNELLTRVGPGTPMGKFFRQYWLPVLPSVELAKPGGRPLRVRLLGEDLLVYRAPNGNVALVGERCPHRQASLYFARNEEGGLRCVYHGWKYGEDGKCIDAPNVNNSERVTCSVRVDSYPCVERNGVIWTFMGDPATKPELPDLEWNLLPKAQTYITIKYQKSNWLQTLEGDIDSSHAGFLHGTNEAAKAADDKWFGMAGSGWLYQNLDKRPTHEVVQTDYGMVLGARRNTPDGKSYWRIYQVLMPSQVMIPAYGEDPFPAQLFVPADDHSVVVWSINWHPTRAFGEDNLTPIHDTAYEPPSHQAWGRWRSKANRENNYFYEEAVGDRFFTVPFLPWQDQAMHESMGSIVDRTKEHLSESDFGIVQARRMWLEQVNALMKENRTPRGVNTPQSYMVRSTSVVVEPGEKWIDVAQERLQAVPGRLLAAA